MVIEPSCARPFWGWYTPAALDALAALDAVRRGLERGRELLAARGGRRATWSRLGQRQRRREAAWPCMRLTRSLELET